VAEAKESPEPELKNFWTDIYVSLLLKDVAVEPVKHIADAMQYKGTEPPFMRGREKEEVHHY
jgi:pyruvate dehydrogenase E1 component alpha subunit